MQQVFTEPKLSPEHTWCKADARQFNVRVGPDYSRYKKKAPSGPPIYEAFAVDVFWYVHTCGCARFPTCTLGCTVLCSFYLHLYVHRRVLEFNKFSYGTRLCFTLIHTTLSTSAFLPIYHSTKLRADHCSSRFKFADPNSSAPINVDTHNAFVPPVFVIQIQIPSDPPSGFFTSAEDGPGWAILMYYRISEVRIVHILVFSFVFDVWGSALQKCASSVCFCVMRSALSHFPVLSVVRQDAVNQLKDLSTASPAVKLFAEWCEKCTEDPLWRGRFKVRVC
jgi:hypothetical protein